MGGSAGFKAQLVAAAGPGRGAVVPHLEMCRAPETPPPALRENEGSSCFAQSSPLDKDGEFLGATQRDQNLSCRECINTGKWIIPVFYPQNWLCISVWAPKMSQLWILVFLHARQWGKLLFLPSFFVLIYKKRTTHHTHLCLNARVMAQYDSVVSRQRHT